MSKSEKFICPKCKQNVKEQVEKRPTISHWMNLKTGEAHHVGACPKIEEEEQNDKTNELQK